MAVELSVKFLRGEAVPFYLVTVPRIWRKIDITPPPQGLLHYAEREIMPGTIPLGRWTCSSSLLGRGPVGEYHIEAARPFANMHYISARFFDYGYAFPFLTLHQWVNLNAEIWEFTMPRPSDDWAGSGAVHSGNQPWVETRVNWQLARLL